MARLIKEGASKGAKGEQVREAARKHPHKQFIIYGKDFVQIIAKVCRFFSMCSALLAQFGLFMLYNWRSFLSAIKFCYVGLPVHQI